MARKITKLLASIMLISILTLAGFINILVAPTFAAGMLNGEWYYDGIVGVPVGWDKYNDDGNGEDYISAWTVAVDREGNVYIPDNREHQGCDDKACWGRVYVDVFNNSGEFIETRRLLTTYEIEGAYDYYTSEFNWGNPRMWTVLDGKKICLTSAHVYDGEDNHYYGFVCFSPDHDDGPEFIAEGEELYWMLLGDENRYLGYDYETDEFIVTGDNIEVEGERYGVLRVGLNGEIKGEFPFDEKEITTQIGVLGKDGYLYGVNVNTGLDECWVDDEYWCVVARIKKDGTIKPLLPQVISEGDEYYKLLGDISDIRVSDDGRVFLYGNFGEEKYNIEADDWISRRYSVLVINGETGETINEVGECITDDWMWVNEECAQNEGIMPGEMAVNAKGDVIYVWDMNCIGIGGSCNIGDGVIKVYRLDINQEDCTGDCGEEGENNITSHWKNNNNKHNKNSKETLTFIIDHVCSLLDKVKVNNNILILNKDYTVSCIDDKLNITLTPEYLNTLDPDTNYPITVTFTDGEVANDTFSIATIGVPNAGLLTILTTIAKTTGLSILTLIIISTVGMLARRYYRASR